MSKYVLDTLSTLQIQITYRASARCWVGKGLESRRLLKKILYWEFLDPKTGETLYRAIAQLRLPDEGQAIKELVVCGTFYQEIMHIIARLDL